MAKVGLVLGGGGVIGHAFHAGVLAALQAATGWDPRTADLVVGTSAGAIVAAQLRGGLSAADLEAGVVGEPLSPHGRLLEARMGTPVAVPLPSLAYVGRGMASPGYLAQAALRPWTWRTGAAVAAALPPGLVSTEPIAAAMRGLLGERWPERPTWITAVRLEDGRRTVFGREGSPPATPADAVAASCAVPAFFRPVAIAGYNYVDGGSHSADNADLAAGRGLDLVVVSAVISGANLPVPAGLAVAGRALSSLGLARELTAIRRRGAEVLVFRPGPEDRARMGPNLMDPGYRAAAARQAHATALATLRESSAARLL